MGSHLISCPALEVSDTQPNLINTIFLLLHIWSISPQTILGVLCGRHIIVHSHPFDHQYGWNLDSFACLYDVDKLTTVHGEANFILIVILLTAMLEAALYMHPSRPDTRYFQGTLHDLFEITTTFPTKRCPPLNSIFLPAGFRNLCWSHSNGNALHPMSLRRVTFRPHT
jgi:hypothetical protein